MRNCICSVFFSLALHANANSYFNPKNYSAARNIYVFDDLPNVAWLIGEIKSEDYYNLRRILREHDIDVLVLDSPGGNLYESLQMAAVVHDRSINTYVPPHMTCASACANIFFAGSTRIMNGLLGVHQFKFVDGEQDGEVVQLTVSDIVSFLNEFDTNPIVYEKMFQSADMYYFSSTDSDLVNRVRRTSPLWLVIGEIGFYIPKIYQELGLPEPKASEIDNVDWDQYLDQLFSIETYPSNFFMSCNGPTTGEGVFWIEDGVVNLDVTPSKGVYKGNNIRGSFAFGAPEPTQDQNSDKVRRYDSGGSLSIYSGDELWPSVTLSTESGMREEVEGRVSWFFTFNLEGRNCALSFGSLINLE